MVTILLDLMSQSLGTLADGVALKVGANYDNDQLTSRSFLMKKIMMNAQVIDLTAGDNPLLFGMCSGELSVGAIKAALEQIQTDNDPAEDGIALRIFWETLRYIPLNVTSNADPTHYEVSLGGGKGIPMQVDQGWQWFVFNQSGGAMNTGAVFKGFATYYGVWL